MTDMTNREICEEIKAIRDLAQLLADKMDELNLRLGPPSKTDDQFLPRWITTGWHHNDDGSD